MKTKRPTFDQARAKYVHRFTMEYIPNWALRKRDDGTYYAPQFKSDAEWYAHTLFKGDEGYWGDGKSCYTFGQTWPLGLKLSAPYNRVWPSVGVKA